MRHSTKNRDIPLETNLSECNNKHVMNYNKEIHITNEGIG